MTGKSRANLYYRLMDICLVLTLLMIINDAVEMFLAISTQSWDGSDGHLSTALTLLGLLSFILTVVIIFARSMRDEFAEMLWQKSAGTMLRAMVILPFPAMILVAVFQSALPEFPPIMGRATAEELAKAGYTPEGFSQFVGVISTISVFWWLNTTLFVFIFQWHRWRASK